MAIEGYAIGVGIYWLVCFLFLFIYQLCEDRYRNGKVTKDDFNEALLVIFPAPIIAPIFLIHEVLCFVRWIVVGIFNIGARNK